MPNDITPSAVLGESKAYVKVKILGFFLLIMNACAVVFIGYNIFFIKRYLYKNRIKTSKTMMRANFFIKLLIENDS